MSHRHAALARARAHAPFLAAAAARHPAILSTFLELGPTPALAAAQSLALDHPTATRLRRQRDALALTVALGDLAGELPLERVTRTLSDFADRAIDEALATAMAERVPDAQPTGMAVLALGKLGSYELNYSSDVDLILLYDPATLPRRPRDEPAEAAVRIAKRMIELLQTRDADGYVTRVDLRLRPASEATPIALPVGAAISYYESQALPWERAAFIRARAAAGDRELGRRFLAEIQPFIWRRAIDFGAIDEIRDISLRIRDHYAQGQALGPGFDLKRGRGGIREAEFFTQVQQLVHGGRDPALRAPATLDALRVLATADRLDPEVADLIAGAYRILRTIEHRAQMIDDRQTHLLPASPAALDAVARLHGLDDGAQLVEMLRAPVQAVEHQFDGLVTEGADRLSNDPAILAGELSRMGFADVATPTAFLANWRSGRARSLRSPAARRAFEAMLPTLLGEIAQGADPAFALNRFSDIVERLSSGVNFFRLLQAKPSLAALLALILTHAPALAGQLARRPILLDGLIDESSFALPPSPDELAQQFLLAVTDVPFDTALDRIRRMVGERRFALGVQLVAAHREPIDVAEGYSAIAEATIVALAAATEHEFALTHGQVPGGSLTVLGLGRLGGQALTHASDLDIVFLFDAPPGARSDGKRALSATDYYNRLASRIVAALSVPTAAGPLYDVDTRLRPQGAQGMLAVSIEAFDRYQREEAWTWEHMALCRARPIAGTAAARARVAEVVEAILRLPRDKRRLRADSGAMRAEMARHKPASGPLDIKLGDGGLVDLEFAVHTLQLETGIGLSPRLELAIAALHDAGLVDAMTDPDLRLLSRMLVVLRLVAPDGRDPPEQSRALVARLCGHDDWTALIESITAARFRIAARWTAIKDQSQ